MSNPILGQQTTDAEDDNYKEEPISSVYLVYGESDDSIFKKWMSWIIVMAIFLLILIYVTNYFANKECFKINPSPYMHYRHNT